MKRVHKKWHSGMWLVIGTMTLYGVYLALLMRPPAPENEALPQSILKHDITGDGIIERPVNEGALRLQKKGG